MKRRGKVLRDLHNQPELVDAVETSDGTCTVKTTTTPTTLLSDYTNTEDSKPRQRMRNHRPLSILPRLGGNRNERDQEYELVEGGQRGRPLKKRFNWKLVVGVGVALLVFVALFGPRERRKKVISAVVNTYEGWSDGMFYHNSC